MREFVIIADDFTGANDTGVQVRKQGIPIDVLLELDPAAQGEGSIVIDTESRVIPPTEAYACMVHIAETIVQQGGLSVFI
ncbi:four-carbon acid sugar kinase family protein [Megasphaera paucivorans]|uniref:four-carbon acid sugar kinase family protein n=1 Tax=Megasphaera paucivorans TaxID=349095 RepID=UPI003D087718